MLVAAARLVWAGRWLAVAIALCLLLDLTYSFGTACPHPPQPSGDKQQVAGDSPQEPCTFRQSIVGRFITWVGDRIDADETPLTTIAAWVLASITLILAAYTALLWGATGKLVKGADDTAKRQLRAYVGITGAPIGERPDHWIVAIDYWNHGQTPAHDVTGSLSAQLFDVNPGPTFPQAEEWPGSWVMVPNAQATPDRRVEICPAQYEAMLNDIKAVFVWGHISYRDVFEWRVNVTFRYRIRRKISGAGWQLHPEAGGNDTTYFPPPKA
jgi:hypothetical protein